MYPILFRLGGFEVTSFGVMVALGALAGFWTFRRELRVRGIPEATDAAVFGLIGGLAGAKLLFVLEHLDTEPAWALLTSRGGLSWFGGLVGGVAAGLLTIRHRRWPMLPVLAAATPALALGQMFGRIGCFLVGDDYGLPTDLPWGVAFPEGLPPTAVPVHPTQLYEAVFLAALALFIVAWRQRGMPDRALLARYCLIAGGFRFALEFIRINVRVAGGLSVAQWASLGLIGLGSWLALCPGAPPSQEAG
ncbi:MAG TPA: prolipoprotein diacylglyceryl transferase family protein [Candidatus Binatia bacterium]|nr:prolipoprotein diacylglyceryl transferase family protein [Candidatus Binatia bacterium]